MSGREFGVPYMVILPPHDRWASWTNPPPEHEPDRELPFRMLAVHGVTHRRIDPFGWPLNPWARMHPILRAIDPLRALRVMLFHRRADLVLCFFESSALVILLLRRLLFFRARVVIFDIGVGGGWRLRETILRLALPCADVLMPIGRNQVAGLLAHGARAASVHPVLIATSPKFFVAADDAPEGYILAVGDDVSRDYATLLVASHGRSRTVLIRSNVLQEDRTAYSNVRVLSDSLSTREYRHLIAAAVLVVLPLHPSVHAGGVSTLLKAMSSAKAVIVSQAPGLRDYTGAPGVCVEVAPHDAVLLRDTIETLLADPVRRVHNSACFVPVGQRRRHVI
jgi:glycosyltransferase involved in cell wall biosynthesis